MIQENFKLYSKYYDLIYRDKTYLDEANYVVQTLAEFNSNVKSLLELGCGSGNHAQFLVQHGLEVTGIDLSSEMIVEAKQKELPNFFPLQGDITDFNLNKQFDAIVSLFHVVSYLTKNEQLSACFSRANKHLKKDGIFLFDCWFTPAVYHLKPGNRSKTFEDEILKVERQSASVMDLMANTIDVHFDIHILDKVSGEFSNLKETHTMRHFSVPEIELLASQNGFRMLRCEELVTKNEPGLETWAVCFMLQKITD